MNWTWNAERMRPAASIAAAVLLLCLPAAGLHAQRRTNFRPGPAMRARLGQSQPRAVKPQNPPRQYQNQQRQYQNQQRPYQNQQRQYQNQQPQYQNQQRPYQQPNNGVRPAPGYLANPGAQNPSYARPAYPNATRPGSVYLGAAPPGHLGDWLNQHRGLNADQQERMLRNDPSFNRLAPATQQRLVQQLHQLNQMPEPQRDRRLARSEMLERMSPQEQNQVRQAGSRLMALPPGRQTLVGHAFQDLSHVPLYQRDTVLNSARYQNTFTPDERNILSNMLRAEPYDPPR